MTFEPINGGILSSEEIQARLDKFNETDDWSLLIGAHPSQQICFMYPHQIKPLKLNVPEKKFDVKDFYNKYKAASPMEKIRMKLKLNSHF